MNHNGEISRHELGKKRQLETITELEAKVISCAKEHSMRLYIHNNTLMSEMESLMIEMKRATDLFLKREND